MLHLPAASLRMERLHQMIGWQQRRAVIYSAWLVTR
jgi:hypothetical protein